MGDEPAFLREELAAFDAIYTELVSAPSSRRPSCELIDAPLIGDDRDDQDNMDFSRFFRTRKSGRLKERKDPKTSISYLEQDFCPSVPVVSMPTCGTGTDSSCDVCLLSPSSRPRDPLSPTDVPDGDQPSLGDALRRSQLYHPGDKLFLDLLDDLDRISGNTPSSRRRKKARDLFAEWLFSHEMDGGPSQLKQSKKEEKRKNRRSFTEYAAQHSTEYAAQHAVQETPEDDLFHITEAIRVMPWKRSSKLMVGKVYEDDTDSGYHTGDSTLKGQSSSLEKPEPGARTLSRDELRRQIEAFNDNQHGLLMSLGDVSEEGFSETQSTEEETATFQGFIRVYMNLMRPISMSLPSRPTSIFDVIGHDGEMEPSSETLTTSFYLPKDTTKVIHISSQTTAQEVIQALLQKFRITDNPRKFALYEKVEEADKKSIMRRLTDEETPLALCLNWTAAGLNDHKFVLQENDTGEIMWEAFSVPELDNFIRILDREEEEYVEQIKAKFQLLHIRAMQQLRELSVELPKSQTEDTSHDNTDTKKKKVPTATLR